MRLSRRAALGLGIGGLLASGLRADADRLGAAFEPVAVEIRAFPFDHFEVADRQRRRFGDLVFRSGVELQSRHDGFGGFSALWRSADGAGLVALTDNAQWLTASVATTDDGRLAGLENAVMAPVLGPAGQALRRTRSYDTESLAIADGVAYIGIERSHEVMRFDWARDGVKGRGEPVPVPPEVKALPRNRGLEAIGVAPARSLLAGALVAVAEEARDTAATTPGFILTGPRRGRFDVVRSDDYAVTDLAFLPSGEMLLLERRFSVLRGVSARLRRIAANAVRPDARVDGPVIFEAGPAYQIDNMEGLAVHRDGAGETVLTLISDDNFSVLQRTLVIEFALAA